MVFFRCFAQVDIFNGLFLSLFFILNLYFVNLLCQIKTESSTAGEQLVRDIFDARQKCHSKGGLKSPFDIFREPYAFKNSSINFFFLTNESPL